MNYLFVQNKKFIGEYLDGKMWNGTIFNTNIKIEILNGNGDMKEFNSYNGKLYFEGEYKNGERNGYGKEYNLADKIFEGEYLNGKRHGKGKEYGSRERLKFEGEYKNGKKNGKGKEYDKNGNLIFEGNYLDGSRII